MDTRLKRLASSLLSSITLVGGLDGAIVYLGAPDASLSLFWKTSALSGLLASLVALFAQGLRALLWSSYPTMRDSGLIERACWGLTLAGGAGALLWSVQLSLPWAHAHARRVEYQALIIGAGVVMVSGLLLLLGPLCVRQMLRVGSWLGRHASGALPFNVARLSLDLSALGLLALGVLALSLAPKLWAPLSTLSFTPLYLLAWALWVALYLPSLLLPRASQAVLIKLMMTASLMALLGVTLSATSLSARDAQLIKQRGVWAPFALQLGRVLTDWDRDGRSRLFGDGDCQPYDPKVRPGAYEPVGRDQNCDGFKRERSPSWPQLLRGVSPSPLVRGERPRPQHLIIITVDALRADAYERLMPKTLAFAERGVRFTQGYSAGATTYWSLPALMGSKLPSAFEMERDQTPARRERLLFEALREQGFHTVLLSNVTIFFVRGLSQGAMTKNFETSRYTRHGERPGAVHMTENILKHVDQWRAQQLKPHRSRLALWAHYYDPHEPYFSIPRSPNASDQARYQATVSSLDDALDALFKGLEARGLLEDTAILFTADHGDEFEEHGGRHHGRTLYQEMVRVPLWLYSPNLPPRELSAPMSHLDVAPTLLSLLELRAERSFKGVSWLSRRAPLQAALFEVLPDRNYDAELVGLVSAEGWKLIYNLSHASFELYQLPVDPSERRDLSAWLHENQAPPEHRERLQILKTALLSYAAERTAKLAQGAAKVRKPWASP